MKVCKAEAEQAKVSVRHARKVRHGGRRQRSSGMRRAGMAGHVGLRMRSRKPLCPKGHQLCPCYTSGAPTPAPRPGLPRARAQCALDEVKKNAVSEDERRRVEKEVQKLTDEFSATIDRLVAEKEKSISLHSS